MKKETGTKDPMRDKMSRNMDTEDIRKAIKMLIRTGIVHTKIRISKGLTQLGMMLERLRDHLQTLVTLIRSREGMTATVPREVETLQNKSKELHLTSIHMEEPKQDQFIRKQSTSTNLLNLRH